MPIPKSSELSRQTNGHPTLQYIRDSTITSIQQIPVITITMNGSDKVLVYVTTELSCCIFKGYSFLFLDRAHNKSIVLLNITEGYLVLTKLGCVAVREW